MIRATTRLCASCDRFPLEASLATGGRALCSIRDEPQDWNDTGCVIYDPAGNREQRKQMVIQLMQQQPQKEQHGTEQA